MTIQRSVAARDGANNAFETVVGLSAKLMLYSGAVPANCAAASPAGLLATLTLPSDWATASSAGTTSKNGAWTGTGSAAGAALSYRFFETTSTTCHEQGTVSATAGGGDLTLDNVNIAISQAITITQWDRTQGNP